MSILRVNTIKSFSSNNIYISGTLVGTVSTASYVNIENIDNIESVLPPFIDSISPTNLITTGSQTLIISGSNFDGSSIGYVLGNDGTRYNPTTSAVNSTSQITLIFSGSDRLPENNDPKDVVVSKGYNLSTTFEDSLTVNASPAWITPAGKLGDISAGTYLTASFFVSASDEDTGDTVSYSLGGGSLPGGLTLITGSGELTGSSVMSIDSGSYNQSGVNYNFTINASDGNVNIPRNFYITKKWLDGSTEALAAPSAQYISDIGINQDGAYYYTLSSGVKRLYTDLTTYPNYPMVLVTRASSATHNHYLTSERNIEDLIIANTTNPTRESKIADTDIQFIQQAGKIRWLVYGNKQIFYRWTSDLWNSNYNPTTDCANISTSIDAYSTPTNSPITWTSFGRYQGGCGGGQDTSLNWMILSGIHINDSTYKGGYIGTSTAMATAPAKYSLTPGSEAWNLNNYVFLQW